MFIDSHGLVLVPGRHTGRGVCRIRRLGVSRPGVVGVTASGVVSRCGVLADVTVGDGVSSVWVAGSSRKMRVLGQSTIHMVEIIQLYSIIYISTTYVVGIPSSSVIIRVPTIHMVGHNLKFME